jgi:hypothetical protein
MSDGPKGFQVSESEDGVRRAERPSHAPTFARSYDEPEPRVVGGFSVDDTTQRRTFDLPHLDVTPEDSRP